MENTKLQKDSIHQPELWSMALEIRKDCVNVALFPPTSGETPITTSLHLGTAPDYSQEKFVESLSAAIYDNPLLLSDFKHIFCLVDTVFTITPDSEDKELYFETLFPDSECQCDILSGGEALLFESPRELFSFLIRTFFGIKIKHRLSTLIDYTARTATNGENIFVNETGRKTDIITFSNGKLLMANTFPTQAGVDEFYYVTAMSHAYGLKKPKIYVRGSNSGSESRLTAVTPKTLDLHPLLTEADITSGSKNPIEMPLTLIALKQCEL